MKNADLIPFILLELSESDKYGFELTKNIETKSQGQIVIKQPTLYTILKKLEKTKFISSYWEDSDIGGKRHYYTLTSNGRMQVSTLPTYESLLTNLGLENVEISTESTAPQPVVSAPKHEEKRISIMDALLEDKPEPMESVLPTEEVFTALSIDNTTETEFNLANAEMLKNEQTAQTEFFANSENVAVFTQKNPTDLSIEQVSKLKQAENSIDFLDLPTYDMNQASLDVKYVDYVDLKKDNSYIQTKKYARNLLFKVLSTSAYLILMIILTSIIVKSTGESALFSVFAIVSSCFALFYPLLSLLYFNKTRHKEIQINLKHRLVWSIAIFMFLFIVILIVNIAIGKNNFSQMLAINNFANIYAPLMLSTSCFVDLVFYKLFLVKK